jgi:hypothetical protein
VAVIVRMRRMMLIMMVFGVIVLTMMVFIVAVIVLLRGHAQPIAEMMSVTLSLDHAPAAEALR